MAVYTNMTTLIELSSYCMDCIHTLRTELNSMYGINSVIIDSSFNKVNLKVTGKIDPRDLLYVVQKYDIHARLVWSKPTPLYPYGYGGYADQYCCGPRPLPLPYHQSYCGRHHQPGCNIM